MAEVINIALGDTVRLRNVDNRMLTFKWNSKPYHVAPGEDAYVPFDLIKMEFGDPRSSVEPIRLRSRDDPQGLYQFIPSRIDEVRRLHAKWIPTYMNDPRTVKFREFTLDDMSWADEPISDRIPKVEVYTLAGDRIYTVVDDPRGDKIIAAVPARHDRTADQRLAQEQSNRITQLEEELAEMKRLLMSRGDTSGAPVDLGPDLPLGSPHFQDPSPVASLSNVIEEVPAMVYNPRTKRVGRKPKAPVAEPVTLEDLPEDLS